MIHMRNQLHCSDTLRVHVCMGNSRRGKIRLLASKSPRSTVVRGKNEGTWKREVSRSRCFAERERERKEEEEGIKKDGRSQARDCTLPSRNCLVATDVIYVHAPLHVLVVV